MRLDGVKPNAMSFAAVLSACARGRSWQRALNLIDTMHEDDVMPDVAHYTSAISSCEKSGAWRHALQILACMKSKLVLPDTIAYNATISACEKGRQWQACLQLLQTLVSSSLAPDAISYRAVIEGLCSATQFDYASHLYRDAVEKKLMVHWKQGNVLDFHDFSEAVAKTALRVVFQDISAPVQRNLVVVVGRGLHSDDNEAILKPALLEMLASEFVPPLEGWVESRDPGAIRISAASINRWIQCRCA